MQSLGPAPSAVSLTRTGAWRGWSSPGAAAGCFAHRTRSSRPSLEGAGRKRAPPSTSGATPWPSRRWRRP
eukprot:6120329-Lingulodinium_polyedra.AAC.1